MPHQEFEEWALGFGGCDGGDIGTPQRPSAWVCGIEWGGDHDPRALRNQIAAGAAEPPGGYDDWRENLAYRFNWQVMKMLAVMNGREIGEYGQFAEEVQPFVQGAVGYFKMNLFPMAFRNTREDLWQAEFGNITGFQSKQDYLAWCRERRFARLAQLARRFKPRGVICLGKTYRQDFARAFAVQAAAWRVEPIGDRELAWADNEFGSKVFVLPFVSGPYGLNSNERVRLVACRISQLLA